MMLLKLKWKACSSTGKHCGKYFLPYKQSRAICFSQVQVPFDTYFKVEVLEEFHKVITMERFMEELAPSIWPPGDRIGKVNLR